MRGVRRRGCPAVRDGPGVSKLLGQVSGVPLGPNRVAEPPVGCPPPDA